MKINKLAALLAIISLAACSSEDAAKKPIKLSVSVDSPARKNVAVLIDRTKNYVIDLDSTGCGSVEISGYDYIFPDIIYNKPGGPVCKLFLRAGDDVTLSLESVKTERMYGRKIGFKVGPSAKKTAPQAAADYLTNSPLQDFSENMDIPFEDFKALIADKILRASDYLQEEEEMQTKDPCFYSVESKRIKYIYSQFLLSYPLARPSWTPTDEYWDELSKYYVEDPELLGVPEYCDYMLYASKAFAQKENPSTGANLATAEYIGKNISDRRVKEMLEKYVAIDYLRYNGLDGSEKILKTACSYIKDKDILADIDAEVERQNPMSPGHMSPMLEAIDIEGNSYDLKALRGKPVYIDVWATWCGPCRAEIPYMKDLEEEFSSKIKFVGLSIDEDKAAWEKRVAEGDMAGLQLYLGRNSEFQRGYKINSIPRFILLDKWGRIINADAPRPSDAESIRSIFNSL